MAESDITPGDSEPVRPRRRRDPDRLEDERRYEREYEGRSIRRNDGEEVVSTIIPYRNVKALLAYYFGVFSLIPCLGNFLGPAAVILGCLGIAHVKKYPTAHGTGHAIAGIVLGALTTLLYWAVPIVLFAIGALGK
jgi:hypothetical protein